MEYSTNEARALVADAFSSCCAIDSVYVNRNTLLHIVVYHGLEDETECVLSRFPTLNIRNGNNQTPWEIALGMGNQALLVKIRNFSIFRDYLLGIKTGSKMSYIDPPSLYENYIDWGYEKSTAHLQVLKKHMDGMKLQLNESFAKISTLWHTHKDLINSLITKLTDAKNASYREIYDSIESERNFRQSIVKITETADAIKSIISSYKKNIFWGGIVEMRRYKGLFLSIWRQYACVICDESVYLYEVAEFQSELTALNYDIQQLHDCDRIRYKFRFSIKDIMKINCNDIQSLINSSNKEPSVLKSSSSSTSSGNNNSGTSRPMSFSYGGRTVYASSNNSNKEEANPEDCEITIEVNNFACFKSSPSQSSTKDIPSGSNNNNDDIDNNTNTSININVNTCNAGEEIVEGDDSQHSLGSIPVSKQDANQRFSSRQSFASPEYRRQSTAAPNQPTQVPYKVSPLEVIYIRMKEIHQNITKNNSSNGINDTDVNSSGTIVSDNMYQQSSLASSVASSPSISSNSHLRNLASTLNLDATMAPEPYPDDDAKDRNSDRDGRIHHLYSKHHTKAEPVPIPISATTSTSTTSANSSNINLMQVKKQSLSSSLPKSSINYMSTIGEEVDNKSNNSLADSLAEKASNSGVSIQALLSVLSHETSNISPQSSIGKINCSSENNNGINNGLSPHQSSGSFNLDTSSSGGGNTPIEVVSESSEKNGSKLAYDGQQFTSTSSFRLAYQNNLKGLIEAFIAILSNTKVDYQPMPNKSSSSSSSSSSSHTYSLVVINLGTDGGGSTSRPGGGMGYYDIIDNFENDDILILSENERESISSIHIEDFLRPDSNSPSSSETVQTIGKLVHLTHGLDAFARRVLLANTAAGGSFPTNRNSMSIASRIAGAISAGKFAGRDSSSSNSNSNSSSGNGSGSLTALISPTTYSAKQSFSSDISINYRDSDRTTLATSNTSSVSARSLMSLYSHSDIIFVNNSKDTMKTFQQICKLNSLLLETRHKRSYFETQLVYVIETREKSLETIHYLQSLLVFSDNLRDNANAVVLSNLTVQGGIDVLPTPSHTIFHIPSSPKYLLEHYLEASSVVASHYNIGIKLLQTYERLNEFDKVSSRLATKLSYFYKDVQEGRESFSATTSPAAIRAPAIKDLYEVDLT